MKLKRLFLGLGLLLLLAVGGFVLWGSLPQGPMPEALAALESNARVRVTSDKWLRFTPTGNAPQTGFIFYPGGRVDPRAYAPLAQEIAAAGYQVVIVPMPLNLAVFGFERAADVIAAYPEIERWAIGGHSLGGAMAAAFAHGNLDAVDGLALWAAYPANNNDLSAAAIEVVSIYGSLDGLATPDKIAASRPLLPPTTRWVEIEGGNHAQFGWYGEQAGDLPATLSHSAQQERIVEATLALLKTLETNP